MREAFILECRIKRMSRVGKEKLIATAQAVSWFSVPRAQIGLTTYTQGDIEKLRRKVGLIE